jgi:hypothetical protein
MSLDSEILLIYSISPIYHRLEIPGNFLTLASKNNEGWKMPYRKVLPPSKDYREDKVK